MEETGGQAMTPEIIAALFIGASGLITSILTIIINSINNRKREKITARKDEVQLLREEVARLQQRVDELTGTNIEWQDKYDKVNEDWRQKYDQLHAEVLEMKQENALLRSCLAEHGIVVEDVLHKKRKS